MTLTAARVNAELTQKEAADLIGITPRTLQNWEQGKTAPDAISATKLCKVYGCTLDDVTFMPKKLAKSE